MTRSIYLCMALLGCQLSTTSTGEPRERRPSERRLTGPVEALDAGEVLEQLDAGAPSEASEASECVQPLSDVCGAAKEDAAEALEHAAAWTFTEVVPRTTCSQGCPYRCAYLIVPDALDWDFYGWGLDTESCGDTPQRLPFGRHGFVLKAAHNRGGVGEDIHTWIVEARPRSCQPEPAPAVELEIAGPYVSTPPHECP